MSTPAASGQHPPAQDPPGQDTPGQDTPAAPGAQAPASHTGSGRDVAGPGAPNDGSSAGAMGHPVWANAHRVTEFLYVGGSLRTGDADPGTVINELRSHGLTHILDCRSEVSDEELVARLAPEIVYHQAGTQDEAAGTAAGWFDSGVSFAREALKVPGSVLLTHCALGQARGPSMAYAVLLDQGYEPGEALLMITEARPQARASYAEHALEWHLNRTGASEDQHRAAVDSLRAARRRMRGRRQGPR